MIRKGMIQYAAAIICATSAYAEPQTGTEILFDSSSYDNVKPGTALTYFHDRKADDKIPSRKIEQGNIRILRIKGENGQDKTVITLHREEGRRQLEHLPADRGNPVFVVFLESAVSAITFATKGSPFYIRNRIKDAFASGGKVSEATTEIDGEKIRATYIEYFPFKGDRNAERMGAAFENLQIRFTLSDDIPGHYAELKAVAALDDTVIFSEAVRFKSSEEDKE